MTNDQRAIEALRECADAAMRFIGNLERSTQGEAIYSSLRAALAAVDAQPAEPPLTHGDIGPLWTACGGSELSSEQWSVMHRFVRRIAAHPAEPARLLVKCMACGHKNFFSEDEAARNPVVTEPVAYGYWNKHLGWYGLSLQPGGSYTEPDRRPLYAAPPTQQRQPLTIERIMDCVMESGLDWNKGWVLEDGEPNRFSTLARAIERAHGIGGDK